MKNRLTRLLWIVAATTSAYAQTNIVGTWQGTFQPQPGRDIRVVTKITRGDNNALAATLYNVDQPSQPINATPVTFQGGLFKMTIPQLNATYEGKLSADGNALTGTLTQGQPQPLNFARATAETAWEIPPPPPPAKPMAEGGTFEVATIKPSNPDTPGQSILVGRGGPNWLTTTNTTLNDLLIFAYGVHPRQITGGPGWMETEKFDITAKPDREGVPNGTQLRTMMQQLLVERFELKFHQEKKELSAYTLALGKSGHKMAKNESGGILPGFGGRGPGSIGVNNSNMKEFANYLQARIVDRPVVDQTGLEGRFNFGLTWRPDQLPPAGPNSPPPPADLESRSDLFTAIQEQLGLKFEPAKVPVEVMVIDKVSKPTDN